MTDPVQFPSTTPRFELPLLFAGQFQKEFFVNAALALCDALIQPDVAGEIVAPPIDPASGDCWLVGQGATGAFAGRDGNLAVRRDDDWMFIVPRDGMRVFDRSVGLYLLYSEGWRRETAVLEPAGGQTVDGEARTAIAQLIGVLVRAGILPAN